MSDPKASTALSPFLPGTKIQYAWDSTTLGYLKTCPRLYQYIMIDGWSSEEDSIHLRFGQEYHSALQDYEIAKAKGEDHQASIRYSLGRLLERTYGWEVDEDTKAGKYKNRRSLIQLVIDYLDHHQHDAAKTYIMQDGKPAVELSFRFEIGWGPKAGKHPRHDNPDYGIAPAMDALDQPYLLCGHLDKVVDFNSDLFDMDHKTTTTTISPHYFKQFSPSNQMTLYIIASKIILDTTIKGVIVNAAQILLEDPNRFVRGFTFRTPDQLEEWMDSLRVQLDQAESYAVNNYWPMNDTACGNYGGCRFQEVCSKSPQVREKFLKASFTQKPEEERWNPLKPR